jgi:hypothetical protein
MFWGIKENRIVVIGLLKCHKEPTEILKILKPLKLTKNFIYRTINRYNETSSVEDKSRSGRPRTSRTPSAIKAVAERIRRNPLRKQKIMSLEMKISKRTMSRIIKDDLMLGAYRRSTGQRLSTSLCKLRVERSRRLLQRHANNGHRRILFTDEKIFTVEEKFNRQNDRVYARSSKEAAEKIPKVERGHHPASIMVWWGVAYDGVTPLHFCEQGVKTKAINYQSDILEHVVKPLNNSLFSGNYWVFQQDSAPAHKAKTTQTWLESNVPDFIRSSDWPSASPDLNPLDYCLWNILEEKACSKSHRNIESLKADLIKAAASIPIEVVRGCIDTWPNRLRKCIKAKGGHFE